MKPSDVDCSTHPDGRVVNLEAHAKLPSRFGTFQAYAVCAGKKEHIVVASGDVKGKSDVLCRIHSECLTGDVMGSVRCDCRDQLIQALQAIEKEKTGLVIYLRQEGRGIGLINKIKAYELQDQGYDTAEANRKLGFKEDLRDFSIAADILKILDIKSVKLLTNNPDKINQLKKYGIEISERVPLEIKPTEHNKRYLETKKEKFGHLIDI